MLRTGTRYCQDNHVDIGQKQINGWAVKGRVRHLTLLEWDAPFGELREVCYGTTSTRLVRLAPPIYFTYQRDDGGLLIPCYD